MSILSILLSSYYKTLYRKHFQWKWGFKTMLMSVCLSVCLSPAPFRQPNPVHCPPGLPYPAWINSPHHSPQLRSHHLSFHRSFTPVSQMTNPFRSYSVRTAFMNEEGRELITRHYAGISLAVSSVCVWKAQRIQRLSCWDLSDEPKHLVA